MKHLVLVLGLLLAAIPCFAQSTVVSGQVTDAGAQAWNNGTFTFTLIPNPNYPTLASYTWTGGALSLNISGNLSATGSYSQSIPSNNAISPQGSFWQIQFCPLATSACFFTTASITGGTMTVNATPPAIAISLIIPTAGNMRAYSTSEISAAVVGSQFYLIGTGLQVCSAVSGSSCTNFTAIGTGGTTPGVFTNTQLNQPFLFTTTGGGTCPMQSIIGGTTKVTDGLSACVNTPTSGVTNGFSDGVGGYCAVNDPTQAGQFGSAACVGVYGAALANANNTKTIGMAPQATSKVGVTGAFLEGMELGVIPENTTDQGFGLLLSFEGSNSQPTNNNMPAISVQTPTGTGTFTSGFKCNDSSISSFTFDCIEIGQQLAGNSKDGQIIAFNAHSGSTAIGFSMHLVQDNFMMFSDGAGAIVSMDGFAASGQNTAYAIAMKATATLTFGQLVKIDTANAGSVVVCTTTDTVCHGVVSGGATVYCAAGNIHCAVTMGSGSRVAVTLGTGTCAIGNFVIVDTTTNGRVKCTATQPAVGATMGLAMTAQASVGGNLDMLTKFQ